MNHLQPLNENRPTPNQNTGRSTYEWTMQSNLITSSIREEDFIENEEPNLVCSISTDSFSSHMNSNDAMDQPDWDSYPNEERSRPSTPIDILSDSKRRYHEPAEMSSSVTIPKPKLSLSMHDISTIPTYPLTSKSTNLSTSTIQSQSMTTDASLSKSKDSGLPRSLSCFSLNSNKNYSHVGSKVKEYIKQIKEENGAKRKLAFKGCSNATSCQTEGEFSNDESYSVKSLIPIIDQLKDELDDKDKMLFKLQENYDTLLMRYAAAENRIDHLRLNSVDAGNHAPFNFDKEDYKKPKASPNMLLLPELENIQRETCNKHNKKTVLQKTSKHECNSKSLSPISKPYSNSIRLDKTDVLPLMSSYSSKAAQCITNNDLSLSYQIDNNINGRTTGVSTLEASVHGRRLEQKVLAVKELSPERLNQIAENPFSKVKRWQESLPSFELIEPSSYERISCTGNNKSVGLTVAASQVSKQVDQHFEDHYDQVGFKESNLDSATVEACKIVNSFSDNMIYLRSISQPNNLSSDTQRTNNTSELKSWLSQSSVQSSTSLEYDLDQHLIPTFNPDGLSLPVQVNTHFTNHSENQFQIPLQKSQTCPSINSPNTPVSRPKSLGLTESSHLRRRKLFGQKARLILSGHLKNSNCKVSSFNHSTTTPESIFTINSRVNHIFRPTENSKRGSTGSYDERDNSLVQCLEEMNQCAQNLKGKSEAIMQNVAKQLNESLE